MDATQLLDIAIDQPNDTKVVPVPEGEYLAIIEEVKINSGVSQKTGEQWVRLDLRCSIDDPSVAEKIGRKPTVRGGTMLELTPQGGLALGTGKNVGLGRIREAAGLNIPGQPFNFRMLQGRPVRVSVKHRMDPNDSSIIYDEVKAFAKPV